MNGGYPAALRLKFKWLHLIHFFQKEKQLAVGGTWRTIYKILLAGKIRQPQFKAMVEQCLFMINSFLSSFQDLP